MSDWKRKRNASSEDLEAAPLHSARRRRVVAERRAFEPADIATATPASNRNSGAPNPPRISDSPNARDARSATRVQLSMTCASIMISTATPRSTSRYVRRVAGAVMR